jgi:hypothetical protein
VILETYQGDYVPWCIRSIGELNIRTSVVLNMPSLGELHGIGDLYMVDMEKKDHKSQ